MPQANARKLRGPSIAEQAHETHAHRLAAHFRFGVLP